MTIASHSSLSLGAGGSLTRVALPADQETLHDARQSVATMLVLIAAGSRTVDDPRQTLTRLQQVESELLLLWSMLHSAGAKAVPARVDVGVEVTELVNILIADYRGRIGVAADTGAWVNLSRTSLRRVVGNLVRNAMRASGVDGHVQVTVTAGMNEVIVLVEDDGPGLGSLPVVNGVGLRSVARLVDEAGGTTSARTTGRLGGATIQVRLPVAATGSAA